MQEYYASKITELLRNDSAGIPVEKLEFLYCFILEAISREKTRRSEV